MVSDLHVFFRVTQFTKTGTEFRGSTFIRNGQHCWQKLTLCASEFMLCRSWNVTWFDHAGVIMDLWESHPSSYLSFKFWTFGLVGLTYSPGQVSDAVDVLHLCPDAQGLAWFVDWHIGIYSQLALCGERRRWEISLGFRVWQLSKEDGRRQRDRSVISIPDMLPWQVPMACRMSWSSLTAAAASSPQLMSGSITSSIRPTPDTCADSDVLHL